MKKVRIKSAVPVYLAAAVWLLFGLIAPGMLLKLSSLLIVAGVSVLAYGVGSKLFPGKVIEVQERANTGDAEVDRQIEQGRARLENLKAYNDALPDPAISAALDRMTNAGRAIFDLLEKDVSKVQTVRRFMNYYLPTAEKLMANYCEMDRSPAKGDNIRAAMTAVENSLEMIAAAFEKQLDSLYRDTTFDMETDITVLETMLAGEGLAGDAISEKTEGRSAQAGR